MSLLFALALVLLPFSALGLLLAWHIARPQRSPADASNRLNKARLIWFAMSREDLFVGTFPWLAQDELYNVGREP
ncbi:hypothetical protein [Achromobacter sp.]|uniref:hypothetical protein n=1 Tax=Achromobacter sp. TaxID=134375 RepID=UPI003D037A45